MRRTGAYWRPGRWAAWFAVWVWVCACGAQDLPYLRQQVWSTEEGLPQSSVHAIAQTRDGYLWAATEGGLARFDGERFKVFSSSDVDAFGSDDLCCLAEGAGDELWVGTADGVVRMEKGRFRRYGVGDGLPSETVTELQTKEDGTVEVDTANGWARWERGRFVRMDGPPAGVGWIGGVGGSKWSFTAQSVSVVANVFASLAGGAAGNRWEVGKGLPAGRVQTLFVDREGVAWVGMNGGLYALRAGDAAATEVTELRGNSVLSVFEDVEGNHWVGAESSGLHVLRRLKFRSEAGLVDTAVTGVVQTADGAIWVGTREDGLRRVRAGVVDAPVGTGKLTSAVILSMSPASDGGLWVGTPDGLNYVAADATRVQQITAADGLPDDSIRALATDGKGTVWVGTRQGLVHMWEAAVGASVKTLTKADGLGGDMIGSLLVAKGSGEKTPLGLWVGTAGGLSLVGVGGEISNYTTRDGLGAAIVTAMAQDAEGELWVGTNGGGLSLLQGGRFVAVPAFPGDRREGNIEGITADGQGYLWFRMDRGVRRIAVRTLRACVTNGRCEEADGWGGVGATYGVADGMQNDEAVAGGPSVGWLAHDGNLWFPTRGGAAIVDVNRMGWNSVPPPVVVERFLVDDVAEDLNQMRVEIPYGQARYTMEYAGLSFTAPSEVRYRFRLVGFDKGWTEAGAKRVATYTNLPPGSYQFRVQAMNEDGVRNLTGAALSFEIVPPIYRRWWFLMVMVLLLSGLVVGMYRLRLRRLRGRFDAVLAERNRMAREIHDTLTQDFVGASLQLDLISQHLSKGRVAMATEQVRRTRQLVTDGLDEARRSIWELRANHSQDSLPTGLRRVVERDQFAVLKPRLHLGGAYRELEPRVEREVLRIAQEALLNVLHHAGATEVTVDLHYSSDTLMLTLADNGVGFAVDEGLGKAGHYGLVGMKERAALIDGTLEISSERGSGTKVTLRVRTGRGAR